MKRFKLRTILTLFLAFGFVGNLFAEEFQVVFDATKHRAASTLTIGPVKITALNGGNLGYDGHSYSSYYEIDYGSSIKFEVTSPAVTITGFSFEDEDGVSYPHEINVTYNYPYTYAPWDTFWTSKIKVKYTTTFYNAITSVSQLQDTKLYSIHTKGLIRGTLGVCGNHLATTNPQATTNYHCDEDGAFAILQNNGNYYLYSVDDEMFITSNGFETVTASHPVTITKNSNGYFMIRFSDKYLNVNYVPGILIDSWGKNQSEWDDGNQFVIQKAGDSFDYSEAFEGANAEYQAALSAISIGVPYTISTMWNGKRYYLNQEGYLVESITEKCSHTFKRTEEASLYARVGWQLDAMFTNPALKNGSFGEIDRKGHLKTNPSYARPDFEGQVWFLGDNGKYAVRATNATGNGWGANTYWTVVKNNSTNLPEADYSFSEAYVWELQPMGTPVTSITLDQTKVKLTEIGQTTQLSATVLPDNAAYKNVIWTSSNSAVAKVSGTGLVTAVGHGVAVITATSAYSSEITASCEVKVLSATGMTFMLRCARGYVGYNGSKLCSTSQKANASEFAIVDYGDTNYLYDATNKAFVIQTMQGQNLLQESSSDLSQAVTGLIWGETGYSTYPWYLEDSSGNWLNMDKASNVFMNSWKDFEGGNGGNTYQVEIVNGTFDATEALQMLDLCFHPVEATFNGSNAKLSNYWYADGSMEPKTGLQEMHAVHYQPGNNDRSDDVTPVTDNKVFVFNLLSGFKGGAINAETTDSRGLSTALTIVFDTKKYRQGIKQTGISGKEYTMTATYGVVSATYNGETKEVVRLMDAYKTRVGRWIEFQNNDFAKDLLNAAPIFNADGKTTDAFYTEMTLTSKDGVPMNLTGDTDFRVRYLRPIDITHVHSGKAYLKDGAEAGYDVLYLADIFTFTEWRQTLPFGYNITSRDNWMLFYGIHDIYFNFDEIETDINGSIEKLDDPNLSLIIKYPNNPREESYDNRTRFRNHIGYIRYQNNGGAVSSYNLFIPFHIVHNWGEVLARLQVPIVGTFDDEKNIHWLDEEAVLATSVVLNKTEMGLAIGQKEKLTATVKPTNATNRNVKWRSSNGTVVTVDEDGLVTAVGSGTAQVIVTAADGSNKTASCFVTVSLPGDVTDDGKVNGADIVRAIKAVLNASTDSKFDVNRDGKVNGADIVRVIQYVLSFTEARTAQLRIQQSPADETAEMTASCTADGINLDLEGGSAFTAFQMMLSLPEGTCLNSVQGSGERLGKHELLFQRQADGRYLVMGYAADNRCIEGATGHLLSLLTDKMANGTVVVSDILLFTPRATTKELPALTIDLTTGIEEIENIQLKMLHDGHIYDLSGRLVLSSSEYERHPEILRTGIYVRNGRKFIVK